MHDVIIYSVLKTIARGSRVYLELRLEFQKQYKQLVPMVWVGASGMDWEPVDCLGDCGMDWTQLEWCGTQHMHSSSDLRAHDQISNRSLSIAAAFTHEQHA